LASRGHDLLVVARSQTDLDSLAREVTEKHKVECLVHACDLGDLSAREALISRCAGLGPWSGLINNAGFGTAGLFAQQDPKREREMVRLNVEALLDLTHAFLPWLKGQPNAFIINVASTAAFQPVPTFASYSATKAFVLSLSEALSEELAADGVHVMALCPGVTETGFQQAADVVAPPSGAASPDQVADFALRSLDSKKRVAVHGVMNALLAFSERFAPRTLVAKMAKKTMEPWFRNRSTPASSGRS
jgi:short-subunit dehydrogenase